MLLNLKPSWQQLQAIYHGVAWMFARFMVTLLTFQTALGGRRAQKWMIKVSQNKLWNEVLIFGFSRLHNEVIVERQVSAEWGWRVISGERLCII